LGAAAKEPLDGRGREAREPGILTAGQCCLQGRAGYSLGVRVALISPYSWTYPGGVTRHIEALGAQLLEAGHEVRILAPFDPDDRLARHMHRGARPQAREAPPELVSLGRTVGVPGNGAVSNVALGGRAVEVLRAHLRHGRYDVAHIHEPVAPLAAWDALCCSAVPLVGTFHCYSQSTLRHAFAGVAGAHRRLNRLGVRIAVSEAAAWTAQRYYGGRYRIVPNGVDLSCAAPAGSSAGPPVVVGAPLEIVFVGQAVERKGLPVLLRAFEALRAQVPAHLTLVGPAPGEIARMMADERAVSALGKVDETAKQDALARADVLCAPSLGGESFGMVLTEAFAAGTPVVASDIPGYREVVRDGVEGLLVPQGDPLALAEALRALALQPARRTAMAAAARRRAERYAWPLVTAEVLDAYEHAIHAPLPDGALRRAGTRVGLLPADGMPTVRPRRMPSLAPPPAGGARRVLVLARRGAMLTAGLAMLALALLALSRIGLDHVAASLVASRPSWVLGGLALMCASMVLRGLAWHAILCAAPSLGRVRRRDALQGTFIGVLMSATLPARLGEPSRALIVARRLGRARETLPVVLGTMVSQTLLNLVALALLGTVMFSSVDFFDGRNSALIVATIAPVAVLLTLLLAPVLVPRSAVSRSARVGELLGRLRAALLRARGGLRVFGRPRLGATATVAQLGAWALQWLSCYALLAALGLDARAGVAGAAAVLLAVNVTAVLPATPANLGVFQAACVAVLTGAFHIATPAALAFGIVLQAVELVSAVIMGAPALVNEGLSWRDVRMRAMHSTPVALDSPPTGAPAPARS